MGSNDDPFDVTPFKKLVCVIVWLAIVFGINNAGNAGKKIIIV